MKRLLALYLCLTAFQLSVAAADTRPNIVFVLVDDQRNTSLGCAGHPQIKTPAIDELARQGIRFENAFVQTPICMASRANLFTGLTTTTHGYHGNPGNPVSKADLQSSFPTLLRTAGYRTAFYGKQHVKWKKGVNGMKEMFDAHEVLHRNPYLKQMPDGSLRHVDEIIGDKSVAFVESQTKEAPFFLYMSFNISHAEDSDRRPGFHYQWPAEEDGLFEDVEPLRPNLDDPKYYAAAPEFLKHSLNRERFFWGYDTPEKYRVNLRAIYRMLAGMDRIVSRVNSALKEKGLNENTIVVYSADNGYYMGDRGFQGKWSHFDQSLHVPLVIYDPRMKSENRGRVIDDAVTSLDIPATILDLAGVPVPPKYQGVSLKPFIDGESPKNWRTDFYCEHHSGNAKLPRWFGVRDDRYTYANYYKDGVELLYDREVDPTEFVNVAGDPEYSDTLTRLREKALKYKQQYSRK
ncbi:sulfatase-like hydrolase/transferase [Stieleria varia]|uniref:Arylsulfatase n=1 Tax=Stieleria varia TaxID=2528005 RepID=A0A5C6AR56_9BACT|nr:sulfatase-like hydrolase/transferase [Stieleria varia]TWU02210.1 Arylsulfatase [Stieleria varia]